MSLSLPVLLQFLGPIAVLFGLVLAYGFTRSSRVPYVLTNTQLGLLFGCVAAAQMHMPIEPMPGLIVDLRNIPVAMAGAFLGFRAMIYCLLIAAAWRIGIGGVGMLAGLAGLLLAGSAGAAWNSMTWRQTARPLPMLVALGPVMSLHLLAVLLLPADIAVWFLLNAAPPIMAINIVTVPLLAMMLEAVRVRTFAPVSEARPDPAHVADGPALPRAADLHRNLKLARITTRGDGPMDVLAIWLNTPRWLGLIARNRPCSVRRADLARAVFASVPEEALIGEVGGRAVIIALPHHAGTAPAQVFDRIADAMGLQEDGILPTCLGYRCQAFNKTPTMFDVVTRLSIMSPMTARRHFGDVDLADDVAAKTGTMRLFAISDLLAETEPRRPDQSPQ